MDNKQDDRLTRIQLLWNDRPDLTQRTAASALKISQSATCQYLNNKIPLNTDIVIKFATLFDVPPYEIDPSLQF